MRKLILIVFVFVMGSLFMPSFSYADSSQDIYTEATKAYYEKDYSKAESLFQKLIEEDGANGAVYYALGNVYFKSHEIGAAMQYYEKARFLMPRDSNLVTNLALAKTKQLDKIDQSFSDYLVATFYFWSSYISLSEYRLLLLVVSTLFWVWISIRFLRRKGLKSTAVLLLFLFYAYVLSGYVLHSSLNVPGKFAVVLPGEVDVRGSYLEKDKPLFQLHAGTKVELIDDVSLGESQHWYKISLSQGQEGWIKAEDLGII
jgi:tetratricopeptide (TPR) repeat protein